MNSIHFHFNGDVNINLSLPDSADRPGYKKLVDSLEDYLHDAAEEAAVTEAEADSIVMVMRPDKTPEVMQETQCWDEIESKGKYDCLEVVSDDSLDVEGLAIVFDGRRVLNLGRERYLLGPVIVYKYDEDGDADVLTAAFKEYSVKLSQKEKRPSVLKALAHLKQLAKSIPSKVREKNQERER